MIRFISMKYISKNQEETKEIARKLASQSTGGEVLCLYGDLGAGKTVFASGVIQYFLPQKRVLSPTFIIVRHYQLNDSAVKNIYHLDLFRIKKETEIVELGLNDLINSDSLVLIEWAEKLGKLTLQKRINIEIGMIDSHKRSIKIHPWKN